MTIAEAVAAELERARAKHGAMASAHEAYAVIREELDEFWDLVRGQVTKRDCSRSEDMVHELVQVAAMAQRAIEDVALPLWRQQFDRACEDFQANPADGELGPFCATCGKPRWRHMPGAANRARGER